MKTIHRSFLARGLTALVAIAVLGVSAFAVTTPPSTAPVGLQLVVAVPPSAQPLVAEDAADALSGVIQQDLTRRGYSGEIHYPGNENAAPALTVRLVEWRTDPLGSIKCTFTAAVRTEAGIKELGLFTGTSMGAWNAGRGTIGSNRLNRADAMEDAAKDATNRLTKSLASSGVLLGFATLKK